MAEHNNLGQKGEDAAADFLAHKGYTILERNWRWKKLEIDLIADTGKKLVIVEVKTRGSGVWGSPEEAVTKGKIKFLAEAAEAFIELHQIDKEVRFDIVTVVLGNGTFQIDHIEEAFHPIVNN
jgi:putative endonuclease